MNNQPYNSFKEFVDKCIIPGNYHQDEWLDRSWKKGRYPKTYAKFLYQGNCWSVKGDTRLKPLMKAYSAITKGEDPFIVELTKGGRSTLRLREDLWSLDFDKLFYIYYP